MLIGSGCGCGRVLIGGGGGGGRVAPWLSSMKPVDRGRVGVVGCG